MVDIWDAILKDGFKSNLSSNNPITDKGKQIKVILKPLKKEFKQDNKTKITPPADGVAFIWELLLFGLTRKYFLKIGKENL